jgi:FeS assembly SUF system protein
MTEESEASLGEDVFRRDILGEDTRAAAETTAPGAPELNPVEALDREARIVEALRTIYDPEIPVDIYELGLVYNLLVDPAGNVTVQMTLTAPSCPEAASIPARVETAVRAVPGVSDVKVELVWEPPWTPARMSEAAKLHLGFL